MSQLFDRFEQLDEKTIHRNDVQIKVEKFCMGRLRDTEAELQRVRALLA